MAKVEPLADSKGRTRLADVIPIVTPFSLYIFPTIRCNFRCVYCAQSLSGNIFADKYPHMASGAGFMNLELFRKVLNQAKDFPSRFRLVSLTGQGEPLLHPELPRMVAEIKEADITERIEFIGDKDMANDTKGTRPVNEGLTSRQTNQIGRAHV